MQRYLTDILNDPPLNLARFANLLLLVCLVLLGSIFFLEGPTQDITLNLSPGTEEEVLGEGEVLMSDSNHETLIALVEDGKEIKRGDTLFYGAEEQQILDMQDWMIKLKKGDFIPSYEQIEKYPLPKHIYNKMLEIAEQDWTHRKRTEKKASLSIDDQARIIELKSIAASLQNEIDEFDSAIVKFKLLEQTAEQNYFNQRDRFERREISLAELTKQKEKWIQTEEDTEFRRQQKRRPVGLLSEINSELKFLNDKKLKLATKVKPRKKDNLVAFESDLAIALDSLINSYVISSTVEGVIMKIGNLNNVQIQDTLIVLKGDMEKKNRSTIIFADAIKRDANKLHSNMDLFIYLKDGSRISGVVEGKSSHSSFEIPNFKIGAAESVSYVDVEEIIVPAKSNNFIQKVLDNF